MNIPDDTLLFLALTHLMGILIYLKHLEQKKMLEQQENV